MTQTIVILIDENQMDICNSISCEQAQQPIQEKPSRTVFLVKNCARSETAKWAKGKLSLISPNFYEVTYAQARCNSIF